MDAAVCSQRHGFDGEQTSRPQQPDYAPDTLAPAVAAVASPGLLMEGARRYAEMCMSTLGDFADAWDAADGPRWDAMTESEQLAAVARAARDHFEADLDLVADDFGRRMAVSAAETAGSW